MIIVYEKSPVSPELLEAAEKIKRLNYKVTHPKNYAKTQGTPELGATMVKHLKQLLGLRNVNWVFFSAVSGAEEHIDQLPENFDYITYVIPLIVPSKGATLIAESVEVDIKPFQIYAFNHTRPHSLRVNSTDGCVMVMATDVL